MSTKLAYYAAYDCDLTLTGLILFLTNGPVGTTDFV